MYVNSVLNKNVLIFEYSAGRLVLRYSEQKNFNFAGRFFFVLFRTKVFFRKSEKNLRTPGQALWTAPYF